MLPIVKHPNAKRDHSYVDTRVNRKRLLTFTKANDYRNINFLNDTVNTSRASQITKMRLIYKDDIDYSQKLPESKHI